MRQHVKHFDPCFSAADREIPMSNKEGNLGVSLKVSRPPEHLLKYCAAGTLVTELGIVQIISVVWWICLNYTFAGN